MARRLHLHIGTMKSATTYLQAICDANADALAERGLLWPGAAASFSAIADLFGVPRPQIYGPRRTTWLDLVEQLAAHDGDALVSNELLAARGPAKIKTLFDALPPAETHLVVTARDLARVAVSQWQERSRHRETERFADFMDRLLADGARKDPTLTWFWSRQDLSRIARQWGAEVGTGRVAIVTVPSEGSQPTVVRDRFFSALGFDAADRLVAPPHM